jgi:transposase InsO family protein
MANRKQGTASGRGGAPRDIPPDYKLLVVQERLRGTSDKDVARAFGVSVAAVVKWTTAFRKEGLSALGNKRYGPRAKKTPSKVPRERVVTLKQEHAEWGTRRIRDVLARFEALGVSETEVRRILHEEGLITSPPPIAEREHPPRRFERATPNQLWQTDIFTFLQRRQERLYLCVFMDDHSRFIVGYAIAHHQKSALVMEAFERGIATYGQPQEVLTDNGRQYTVWRGRTVFEETLERHGIQHIRSRPQHPQTLGKVERFWKTLWDEFLGRTVFADFVDAQRRLEHYFAHYNFQRPHQALDGLVPADRFFRAATHVRETIEKQIAANALRLALEQQPRKPFYVVGQLGDQRLSIAAGETELDPLP